jgi:hypothetical protein
MTLRQAMVCLVIGPISLFLLLGLAAASPLFAFLFWLIGDNDPVMTTREMVTGLPLFLFMGMYRGL